MVAAWLCTGCGKVLGSRRGGRLHINFARGYKYIVSLPATAVCLRCGILNELREEGISTVAQAAQDTFATR